MNIDEQTKLSFDPDESGQAMQNTRRSQLREGDRAWGGRLSESCQPMNKNIIRGDQSGMSVHNLTKSYHSALGVNGAVGQRRFQVELAHLCNSPQCLPTEVSLTSIPNRGASHAAMCEVISEKSAEVIIVRANLRSTKLSSKDYRGNNT